MPYFVVPVVHKFGIISQAHKRELQARLLQRRIELEEEAKLKKETSERFDLHITEEFVNKYNESSPKERQALDDQCNKIYEKIKRKLIGKQADDLNLQIAWAELSQLVQCNSLVQEDCLNLFIISLENSKMSSAHIPTLFFLAETFIYWLRIDTINQPYLRALEIKLLKVTQLVFQRLYYHFVEGIVDEHHELKQHLNVYLDGFENSENVYTPYPDALIYMRYIIAVGRMILKEIKLDDIKSDESFDGVENHHRSINKTQNTPISTTNDTSSNKTITNNVHELSPTLWHCVDLYMSVIGQDHASAIEDATFSLIECSLKLNEDYWVNGMHGLAILGECAKLNLKSLEALLSIAEGRLPDFYHKSAFSQLSDGDFESPSSMLKLGKPNKKTLGIQTWDWELGYIYVEILGDICINGRHSEIRRKALLGTNKTAEEALRRKTNRNRIVSFGLLDMMKFYPDNSDDFDESEKDWGWKIRYSAIKCLVSICKILKDDKDHEEFRNLCWSALVVCQETELNIDVLEALKVGQVSTKREEFSSKIDPKKKKTQQIKSKPKTNDYTFNIHCQMAKRLGDLFIKPIFDKNSTSMSTSTQKNTKFLLSSDFKTSTTINEIPSTTIISSKKTNDTSIIRTTTDMSSKTKFSEQSEAVQHKETAVRTGLRDEIDIRAHFELHIPDYFTRKRYDLMRIAEDQYRKEMEKEFESQQKS